MTDRTLILRRSPWMLLLVLTAVIHADFTPARAQAGQAGLSFLKLGVSARGIAMADAMSATTEGPASLFYNPAGLVRGDTTSAVELLFTHREWIEDTRVEFLAGKVPISDNQAVGLALTSTTVPDIELRTRPGDP